MYQALYRKYRPKCFADVYGQEHVVATLKNELNENRISHAYLFTGSRGTGKTTCAKILAKAVNCESPVNGEPCNECEVCKGLDSGAIYDVVEIDAASNNGVDNIRDLREEANYTPSRGRYRVYIIDEVHMLSTGAFNALLKTLEEPPAHVIFILATTEVHKLPATILSRCQRFDFKRIQPETMSVRLKQVAELEGLTITDDAAILIARIADGALRDGLSILDQCSGRSSNIDAELVSQVAGLAGREALHKLSHCISARDSASAIQLIADLYQNSYDMERLCNELAGHFRNYLIVKTVKNSRELIVCTDDEYSAILDGSKECTLENVIFALDLMQTTLTKIKSGANARVEMEMAFVRLCEPRLEESMSSVLDRLSQLERAVKNGVKVEKAEPVAAATEPESPAPQDKPQEPKQEIAQEKAAAPEAPKEEKEPEPQPQPSTEPQQVTAAFDQWQDFLDIIHKTDIALFGVLSNAGAHIQNEHFVIDSSNPSIKEFIKIPTHLKAIKQAVLELTGTPYKIAVSRQAGQSSEKRDLLEDLINQAQGSVKINFE